MTARRRAALAAAIALATCGALADGAFAITTVDLSTYHRTAAYDLPVGTGADLQASEASGVAYDPDDDSLYVVGDEGTSVAHVDLDGTLIDTMTLNAGDFEDTEGIAYLGGGRFALTEERLQQVDRFTYVPNTTLTRAAVDTVDLGPTVGNVGLEGISADPANGGLVLVKETTPEGIFATQVDWAAGTATNGAPSTDLFPPASAGLDDFSDVFALGNLPSLAGQPDAAHLLMISQESGRIINVDRSGAVASSLTLRRDPGNALSIPEQTVEGITMDDLGTLYVVSEQGGGLDTPQLWVYQPTATPNAAPSAVTLTSSSSALPESASTAGRRKLADVDVADADGLGVNALGVSGPDAADFAVDDTGLYLRAGVALDYEAKSSYSVSVTADDTSVGATPDATSIPYTLTLTNVADGAGATAGIRITEVAPWASGGAYTGADWWELTNAGTEPVDLTGWKVDDSSASASTAVALDGVGLLQPGQSAIFLEGDATAVTTFETAWFGGAPPAGVQVGYYAGSGVGLGTSGDGVVVFDAGGAAVTGVAFGASTNGTTFDNAAGAGTAVAPYPELTALTVATQAGATAIGSGAGAQLGSPGAVDWPVRVTEAHPTGSANATYAADWFEVTNTGTIDVPLSGWRIDDATPAFASAVPLAGADVIAPGESVVFVEGTAPTAAAFRTPWYGSDATLKVGSYTGSGVGLSSGGDQVNLYDSVGHHVTGIAFGAATAGVTFDNHAGAGTATLPVPAVTALSARGAFGARVAGAETGSPGTVAPDATGPVITVGGAKATYDVGERIRITCAAADEALGAGLDPARTDCADLDRPASDYGVGAKTITWTATDYAGNVATRSVTFTVTKAAPAPAAPRPAAAPPAAAPAAPSVPPVPRPGLTRPSSARSSSLVKGVGTRLTGLRAGSRVTLAIRYAGRTLATVKGTAGASGGATVKVRLSRARLAKLKGKTLTLRYSITGADGKATTLTSSLKLT